MSVEFAAELEQVYGPGAGAAIVPEQWAGQRLRLTRGYAEFGYFKDHGYNDDGTVLVTATGRPYGARVVDVLGVRDGWLYGRPGRCPMGISITQIIWLVIGLPAPVVAPVFFFIAFGGTSEDLDPVNFIIPVFLGLVLALFSLVMVGALYYYYREPVKGAVVLWGITAALVARHEYLRHDEREGVREDQAKWANVTYQTQPTQYVNPSAPPVPLNRQVVQNPTWDYSTPYGTPRFVYLDELTPLQQRQLGRFN